MKERKKGNSQLQDTALEAIGYDIIISNLLFMYVYQVLFLTKKDEDCICIWNF